MPAREIRLTPVERGEREECEECVERGRRLSRFQQLARFFFLSFSRGGGWGEEATLSKCTLPF